MDWDALYLSPEWAELRGRALARDADRCTVARLLGGRCSPLLHAHHLDRDPALALELDNVVTACARHHPKVEAIRRAILERRDGRVPPCRHRHRYDHARRACRARREAAARAILTA